MHKTALNSFRDRGHHSWVSSVLPLLLSSFSFSAHFSPLSFIWFRVLPFVFPFFLFSGSVIYLLSSFFSRFLPFNVFLCGDCRGTYVSPCCCTLGKAEVWICVGPWPQWRSIAGTEKPQNGDKRRAQKSCMGYLRQSNYHAGGDFCIHDLFGGARIFRICDACLKPKVFRDPNYVNMLGHSLPVGSAQQTTEKITKNIRAVHKRGICYAWFFA